jgi:hypothetical protein
MPRRLKIGKMLLATLGLLTPFQLHRSKKRAKNFVYAAVYFQQSKGEGGSITLAS